ncbi:MAG: hypothetical protein EXQ99_07770 [Alphaproteobacteria bacterium]|nr:hypothetical protein [Alphaproteobacteria bacterium]
MFERRGMMRGAARLALASWLAGVVGGPLRTAEEEGRDLGTVTLDLKARQTEIDQGREDAAELGAKVERYRGEVDVLRRQTIEVAAKIRALERGMDEIEARVATLTAQVTTRKAALDAGRPARANAIGAMLRLSRQPPKALLLAPNSAVDATRSALLLAGISRGLETNADALKVSLREYANRRSELADERARLSLMTLDLAEKRVALDNMRLEKSTLERGAAAERAAREARVAALVGEAHNLEELIQWLEASAAGRLLPPPPKPDPDARIVAKSAVPADAGETHDTEIRTSSVDQEAMRAAESPREGAFSMPAEGAIVRQFGAPTAPGVTAKGLSIAARPGGPVVAPFAGEVVFAGPFRDFGQLLIIAHGEGYHTLLAGLGRIDTALGRWVLAGEPLGMMISSPEIRPQLYVELRHKGRPVNPMPWLATGPIKSSGS